MMVVFYCQAETHAETDRCGEITKKVKCWGVTWSLVLLWLGQDVGAIIRVVLLLHYDYGTWQIPLLLLLRFHFLLLVGIFAVKHA